MKHIPTAMLAAISLLAGSVPAHAIDDPTCTGCERNAINYDSDVSGVIKYKESDDANTKKVCNFTVTIVEAAYLNDDCLTREDACASAECALVWSLVFTTSDNADCGGMSIEVDTGGPTPSTIQIPDPAPPSMDLITWNVLVSKCGGALSRTTIDLECEKNGYSGGWSHLGGHPPGHMSVAVDCKKCVLADGDGGGE